MEVVKLTSQPLSWEAGTESIVHRFGGGCPVSSWFRFVLLVKKGALEGSEGRLRGARLSAGFREETYSWKW